MLKKNISLLVVCIKLCLIVGFAQTTATITVNTNAVWGEIDSTMVGFSFNPAFTSMNFSNNYNGIDTRTITKNLFNNFYPFQQPTIRINGTNNSYWSNNGAYLNPPTSYNVNSSNFTCLYCPSGSPSFSTVINATDVSNVQSFISTLSYKPVLLWGINITAIDTGRIADMCNSVKNAVGNSSKLIFEIGNEPDAFVSNGRRNNGYDYLSYNDEITFISDRVKRFGNIAIPALAKANPTTSGGWASSISSIINAAKSNNLTTVTYHDYPLGSASGGTVSGFLNKYLSDSYTNDDVRNSTTGLIPSINTTLQNNLTFRLGEANTISGGGVQGASDVMGAALWGIDMMFELAKAKAAGINFAVEGSSSVYYSPFTYNTTLVSSGNKVLVSPLYYGALFFARAAQNHAHIVSNSVSTSNNPNVKVWAMLDRNNTLRIVVINRGTSITDNANTIININLPGVSNTGVLFALTPDNAPGLSSSTVSINGQKVDQNTGLLTGTFNAPSITPTNNVYSFTAQSASIYMLEIQGVNCVCQ